MKFIFFGTPYVARDTLEALLENGFKPELVVSNPDAPRGRGRVMTPSETKVLAEQHNLPVYTPMRLDAEAVAEIKKYNCDFAIVVAYGKILPQSLLDIFPKGVFNIHYSLLPKYRGASPVETALLNNDAETGVTIQKMVLAMDAGDILAQEKVDVLNDDNTTSLRKRLIDLGNEMLIKVLPDIQSGNLDLVPQDSDTVSFASKMKKEDGLISFEDSDLENWSKYRAYVEWPGTYFFENGKRIKITKAHFDNGKFMIDRVIPEGKKEMDYRRD